MTDTIETRPMLIGGRFRLASDGAAIDAVNPANGTVIAKIPHATAEDVNDAVSAAKDAYPLWRRLEPPQRASALIKLAAAIEASAEEFALLDVADNGSPIREMRNDAAVACAQLRYYAGLVLHTRGETIPTSFDRLDFTTREPYGVVARIIPFNHPLMFAASKIAAPLAAGNTVIVKPSEHTSLSALRLAELASEIFPAGVVNVVTGEGATTGDALVTHPDIRRLAFIGAAETGRAILARAASVAVKTVSLELGGKNPLVIFPDADLDVAVDAAVRGMNFTWQGQSCGSTSRLLVHRDVYRPLLDKLATTMDGLRSGVPDDPETETGAIVNTRQLEKVRRYIQLGRDENAELLVGGTTLTEGEFAGGNYLRPALFADVRPDSRLAQEEIFGPVLAAMPFETYEEAVAIANSVRYGLTAGVFTRELATGLRFARDVEAGYVWVNDVSRHTPGTPFGGFKDSGLGREEDIEELLAYTQVKNVHVSFA
ncbi:aldehyde dehydrogenase family protein [Amycolatopsis sp. GM8]|uniref:aldehyde dehydrogenase family protein n=1 Tax=Amycolatopsis sp. GM8 TaxID=2896530 RepID=UPI001F1785A1|nr:aldehyde dehydrogenase family protein [Amycolatopsis sp. GM8]